MSVVSRIGRWLFSAQLPAERLAALRLLVFGFGTLYLLARGPHLTDFSRLSVADFAPVGPVSCLSTPLPSSWVFAVYAVTTLAGMLASLGLFYRGSAPTYALGLLWVTSYRNSWGMIFHTENLLVLHSLILSVSPAADRFRWRSKGVASATNQAQGLYAWPVRALSLVTVLSYVLAGVAKLQISGLGWADGHALRTQIAFDALRKIELGSSWSPLGVWLVKRDWAFTPLAWLTLGFELGAPLALLGKQPARLWCAAVWSFHVAVLALMLIVFPYPLSGIALASFFPCENWIYFMDARWRRLRDTGRQRTLARQTSTTGSPDA